MKFFVHKFPGGNQIADCREVLDTDADLSAPFELMTPDAFATWAQPWKDSITSPVVDAQPAFDPTAQKLISIISANQQDGKFHKTFSAIDLTDGEKWANFQEVGYLDAQTAIRLKTTDNAMNYFTAQATLLSTALGAGDLTPSTQVQIWDTSGQPHTLAVSDMLALLLRYGFAYQTAYAQFAP